MDTLANAIALVIVLAFVGGIPLVDIFIGRRRNALIGEATEDEPLATEKPRICILPGNWIRWRGDADCPLPPNTVIETIHGDGAVFTGRNARYAKEWRYGWRHGDAIALDIIFFRIVR